MVTSEPITEVVTTPSPAPAGIVLLREKRSDFVTSRVGTADVRFDLGRCWLEFIASDLADLCLHAPVLSVARCSADESRERVRERGRERETETERESERERARER